MFSKLVMSVVRTPSSFWSDNSHGTFATLCPSFFYFREGVEMMYCTNRTQAGRVPVDLQRMTGRFCRLDFLEVFARAVQWKGMHGGNDCSISVQTCLSARFGAIMEEMFLLNDAYKPGRL